jgi:hypothetical protein
MSQDPAELSCPVCHSTDVNMTGEPTASHKPENHGWYGQAHTVTIPMQCKCGQNFTHEVAGYKCRVTVRTEVDRGTR